MCFLKKFLAVQKWGIETNCGHHGQLATPITRSSSSSWWNSNRYFTINSVRTVPRIFWNWFQIILYHNHIITKQHQIMNWFQIIQYQSLLKGRIKSVVYCFLLCRYWVVKPEVFLHISSGMGSWKFPISFPLNINSKEKSAEKVFFIETFPPLHLERLHTV